jgi:hypothetical protein
MLKALHAQKLGITYIKDFMPLAIIGSRANDFSKVKNIRRLLFRHHTSSVPRQRS